MQKRQTKKSTADTAKPVARSKRKVASTPPQPEASPPKKKPHAAAVNGSRGDLEQAPAKITKKATTAKSKSGAKGKENSNGPASNGPAQIADDEVMPQSNGVEPKVSKAASKRAAPNEATVANKKPKVATYASVKHTRGPGRVLCLGSNDMGQLGQGEAITERKKPALIVTIPTDTISEVVAGGMHTVILDKDGKVYTFGCNDEGALGLTLQPDADGKCPDQVFEPMQVDGLPGNIVQITAGDSHSAALTSDGIVFMWGNFRDNNGQIGLLVPSVKEMRPVRLNFENPSTRISHIASGTDHFVCISTDGILYTLGNGENGQLGRLAERFCQRGGRYGIVDEMLHTIAVASATSSTDHLQLGTSQNSQEAVGCESTVYDESEMADGTASAEEPSPSDSDEQACSSSGVQADAVTLFGSDLAIGAPVDIDEIRGNLLSPKIVRAGKRSVFDQVWAGNWATFAHDKTANEIVAFGLNNYFQLGINDLNVQYMLQCVKSMRDVKWTKIAPGQHHTLLLSESGQVYSLGRSDYGRLGLGDDVPTANHYLPRKVSGLTDCVDISAGIAVSYAVTRDGRIFAFGSSTSGLLGQGEGDDDEDAEKPVQVNSKHLDGRRVVAVSAGGQHTVFLAAEAKPVLNGGGSGVPMGSAPPAKPSV